MSSFATRLAALPRLGLGVSTEYGAGDQPHSLELERLLAEAPRFAGFLEIGVELSKGLDRHAERWLESGRPTTYHFLDINLDDPDDFDVEWLNGVRSLAQRVQPAWLCGDAGLWHFGPRERGHLLLLPPILSDDAATAMAEGIVRLREETGLEVLPENPPGPVYLGDLHLLDFFARVCERADTGMLLDCAHLAIYQSTLGHAPLTGLDGFPTERIVEMHVAGGIEREHEGYRYFEDSHTPDVLPETWQIFEHATRASESLRAIVFECERNPVEECLVGMERIGAIVADTRPELVLEV